MKKTNKIEWYSTPKPMAYGERLDYFLCECGNHYGDKGFNRCDLTGKRIPLSLDERQNIYGLCEKCGCIINFGKHLVIGKLKTFKKRKF